MFVKALWDFLLYGCVACVWLLRMGVPPVAVVGDGERYIQ